MLYEQQKQDYVSLLSKLGSEMHLHSIETQNCSMLCLKNVQLHYKTEITSMSVCITTVTNSFPVMWHWGLSEPAFCIK